MSFRKSNLVLVLVPAALLAGTLLFTPKLVWGDETRELSTQRPPLEAPIPVSLHPEAEELLKQAAALEASEPDRAAILYREVMSTYSEVPRELPLSEKGAYREVARERLHVLSCRKVRGETAGAISRPELLLQLRANLEQGQSEALVRLAACDFRIGFWGSDWVAGTLPQNVVREILPLDEHWTWPQVISEQETEIALRDADLDFLYLLQLSQRDDRWYWNAFYTSDQGLFQRLIETKQSK